MYWDVPRGASYGEKVMRKFKYTIKEEQGIHARPASFLIQEARTYDSRITLRVKGKRSRCIEYYRCDGIGCDVRTES